MRVFFIPSLKKDLKVLEWKPNNEVDFNKIAGFYSMIGEKFLERAKNIKFIFTPPEDEEEYIVRNTVKNLEIYSNFSWRFLDIERIKFNFEDIILCDWIKFALFWLNETNCKVFVYVPYLLNISENLKNFVFSDLDLLIDKIIKLGRQSER